MRRRQWPYIHGARLSSIVLELIDVPDGVGNVQSCVTLLFVIRCPSLSTENWSATPRGITLAPFMWWRQDICRGINHPCVTSFKYAFFKAARCVVDFVDLWFPRSSIAVKSDIRVCSSGGSSSWYCIPFFSISRKSGQSVWWHSSGSRWGMDRNSDPGVRMEPL